MRAIKLLLITFVLAFAFASEVKLKRVERGLYMVRGVDGLPSLENRGFMSNAYAVLTREGWVVIDALTTPELSGEFVRELWKVKRAPIRYAIITHYHPDHWYGVKTYKDLGATVVAHKKLMEFYQSGDAQMALEAGKQRFGEVYKDVVLVPPDLTVEDKHTLRVGDRSFEITALPPAHTNSDLIVYMPKEKVAFVGDLVVYNRIPFMGDRNASSKGLLEVLKLLKTIDIRVVLGGHNDPMDKKAIDFTMAYVQYLRENIKRLKEQGKSLDEIKEALKDNSYSKYVMYHAFHNANLFKVDTELDLEE
ncbi:MAG: MBL fold metallo-hydrolase [Acidobacteria bacterium]|nr:MAG: MBL fold metallo-hydrolase [Acidobacteriota bacterium]